MLLAGSHGPLPGRGLWFTFSSAPRSPINRCSGAGGERGLGNGSGSGATKICVNFDQTQEAYKSKDSLELLRSLVVFKLCSYDFLVDRNREVMQDLLCYSELMIGLVINTACFTLSLTVGKGKH